MTNAYLLKINSLIKEYLDYCAMYLENQTLERWEVFFDFQLALYTCFKAKDVNAL